MVTVGSDSQPQEGNVAVAVKIEDNSQSTRLKRCLNEGTPFIVTNSVTELSLSGKSMSQENRLNLMIESIRDNESLEIVKLGDNNLSCDNLMSICANWQHNYHLKLLNLDGNPIGDAGLITLCNWLQRNNTLERLSLNGTKISDDGLASLFGWLSVNSSLIQLHLANNAIFDDGAKDLASALQRNSTLQVIGLDKNRISNKGFIELAKGLTKNVSLTHLSLKGNTQLNDDGALEFKRTIADYSPLVVYLSETEVTKEMALWLTTPNEDLKTLHELVFFKKRSIMRFRLKKQIYQDALNKVISNALYRGTPLHLAAINDDLEAVQILLAFGADPSIRNSFFGERPLDLAKSESIKTLLQVVSGGAPMALHSNISEIDVDKYMNNIKWEEIKFETKSDSSKERTILGSGGSCSVFKAHYRNQIVAVKSLANNQNTLKLIRNEVRILLRIMHENVIKVIGTLIDNEKCMLVLEYAHFGNLRGAIETGLVTFKSRGLSILIGIASGLNYIHMNNVIHLDLKSENVLLDLNWNPKISDVGIARVSDKKNYISTAYNKYTTNWAPPEAFIEPVRLSQASDVFSFGMIVLEILTGKLPWHNFSEYVIPSELLKGNRPSVPNDAPMNIKKLLEKAWKQYPEQRLRTYQIIPLLIGAVIEENISLEPVVITEILEKRKKEQEKELAQEYQEILSALTPEQRKYINNIDTDEIKYMYDAMGDRVLLGEGATSAVFKAMYKGTEVAVKVVQCEIVSFVIAHEAAILSKVAHENVVGLIGTHTNLNIDGLIVLELAHRGDLSTAIYKKLVSFENKGLKILQGVARGLEFIHAQGIAHLDMKSGNILLDSDWNAKIADVGLARTAHRAFFIETAQKKFTTNWAPPEAFFEPFALTIKSDIYGFGMVIYEVLSGEIPWRTLNEMMIPPAVLRGERPQIPKHCPKPLVSVLKDMWHNDPNLRPVASKISVHLQSLSSQKFEI